MDSRLRGNDATGRAGMTGPGAWRAARAEFPPFDTLRANITKQCMRHPTKSPGKGASLHFAVTRQVYTCGCRDAVRRKIQP